MNTVRMTLRRHQPHHHLGLVGRTTRHLVRAAVLFILSGALTAILVHLLLEWFMGRAFPLRNLFRPDMLWPTLALAGAVTFANYAVLTLLSRKLLSQDEITPAEPTGTEKAPAGASVAPHSHRLDHLNRSAERLDVVEQDLIRKMSHSYPIDSTTQRLLTEMRICTNRLRGELCDMEGQEQGTTERATLSARHPVTNESGSPDTAVSDMKFDDVAVG